MVLVDALVVREDEEGDEARSIEEGWVIHFIGTGAALFG